jgi:hypothetical protein
MASIELSAGMMSGLPARIIRLNEDVGSHTPDVGGLLGAKPSGNYFAAAPMGHFTIMKGAFPTGAIPTTYSGRSADILVEWQCIMNPSGQTTNYFSTTNQGVNPALINSIYRAAAASGLATWFMWFQRITNLAGALSDSLLGNTIIGTVGNTGSGADLEIPDVNVVAGTLYRLRNLQIEFPSQWTY